jgi:hypothetical protein
VNLEKDTTRLLLLGGMRKDVIDQCTHSRDNSAFDIWHLGGTNPPVGCTLFLDGIVAHETSQDFLSPNQQTGQHIIHLMIA